MSSSRVGSTDHETIVRAGLQSAAHQALCLADQETEHKTSIIVTYLSDRVPGYVRLAELRQKGWKNPAADKHFKTQRRKADKPKIRTSRFHFKLMQKVGREIHEETEGFVTKTYRGSILDMCAAPGGFLKTAIDLNHDVEVTGFSLPPEDGGHFLCLPPNQANRIKLLDITLLAGDMGATNIPSQHPDADNFLPRQIPETKKFDLVFCDGHVLRTHASARAQYREGSEPTRLKTTQLALGLEHLKPGGTMILLLSKIDSWNTVCFLYQFSKFASIHLYKPEKAHADRSSFYMIATAVRSQDPEAIAAIRRWKSIWLAATFGTEEDFANALHDGERSAEEVLQEFGPTLIEKGAQVWRTQANALAKAPFMTK